MHLPVHVVDVGLVQCCFPLLWVAGRHYEGTHQGLFYEVDSPGPRPEGGGKALRGLQGHNNMSGESLISKPLSLQNLLSLWNLKFHKFINIKTWYPANMTYCNYYYIKSMLGKHTTLNNSLWQLNVYLTCFTNMLVLQAVGRAKSHIKPNNRIFFKLVWRAMVGVWAPGPFRTDIVMTWWEERPISDEYAKMVTKIFGLKSWSVPGTWNGWARPARHLDKAWNTSSKIISPVLSSCRTPTNTSQT